MQPPPKHDNTAPHRGRNQHTNSAPLYKGALIESFFSSEGPLAKHKSDYRPRREQLRFALAVEEAITERGVLAADCPTGTGKSLGYLAAPCLLGEPIIISTATIALQHQLLEQELPLMARILADISDGKEELGYALMKGRQNYLCENRFRSTLSQGTVLDSDALIELEQWAATTETGDREELQKLPRFWSEVAADAEDCVPARCPYRQGCFYFAHKERAEDAQVLVVNHSLLMKNLAVGERLFEMAGRHLILDEAHQLEEVMAEAFGKHVSRARVGYAVRTVEKKLHDAGRHTQVVESAADLFFEQLKVHTELGSLDAAPPAYDRLLDALMALRNITRNNPSEEVNKLSQMVHRLYKDLKSFYEPHDEAYAYAIVASTGRRSSAPPELKSWLVDTASVFREKVLGRGGEEDDAATILTSATLAAGGSFEYVKRRLGITSGDCQQQRGTSERLPVREFRAKESFDYRRKALVYLEEDLPEPTYQNTDAFEEGCLRRVEQLVGMSGGGALVLLSTNRAVQRFRRSFDTPYPVRFQGDAPPSKLTAWLKESEEGILVATRTYWQGVDIPGPALRVLVIDRTPFAPPSDPVAARLKELYEKQFFSKVALPKAQIAIRQGAGRLIRTSLDQGLIAILDPRIKRRGWGKAIQYSLPPAPATSSLEEVEAFLESAFGSPDGARGRGGIG